MPVPEEVLVTLATLRAEEDVEQVLPPGEECPQVSLAEVARQEVEGEHCLLARLVSVDTDHITVIQASLPGNERVLAASHPHYIFSPQKGWTR